MVKDMPMRPIAGVKRPKPKAEPVEAKPEQKPVVTKPVQKPVEAKPVLKPVVPITRQRTATMKTPKSIKTNPLAKR